MGSKTQDFCLIFSSNGDNCCFFAVKKWGLGHCRAACHNMATFAMLCLTFFCESSPLQIAHRKYCQSVSCIPDGHETEIIGGRFSIFAAAVRIRLYPRLCNGVSDADKLSSYIQDSIAKLTWPFCSGRNKSNPPIPCRCCTVSLGRQLLDLAVYSRRSLVCTYKAVGMVQDVQPINLVIEKIETVLFFLLGFPVQFPLKFPDLFWISSTLCNLLSFTSSKT